MHTATCKVAGAPAPPPPGRFAVVVVLLTTCCLPGKAREVDLQVDWSTFLEKHDLVWKFQTLEEAPTRWLEGGFLGDGLVGAGIRVASIKGGLALRMHIGRSDIWDRRTGKSRLSMGNNFQYDRPRLPIGWFDLQLKGRELKGGRMRLSLWNGELEGALKTDAGEVDFYAYAHATDSVIVARAAGNGGEANPRWDFTPDKSAAPIWHVVGGSGYKLNPPPKRRTVGSGTHMSEQALLAGGSYSVVWREEGGHLFATVSGISRGRRGSVKAVEPIDRAARQDAKGVRESHRRWWHSFWEDRGTFITFPETWLEGFWYIQMYKLGSATRADRFVIDNNGPWLFTPTTWADIHWDLNLQLSYLPMFTANRLDLSTSLIKYIQRPEVQKALASNVPKRFHKGPVAMAAPSSGSSMDAKMSCYWSSAKSCLVEPGPYKGAIVGNLVWVAHVLWMHYRYGMDESVLLDVVYPVLHKATAYYLHILKKGRGGRLELPTTASPEYKSFGPNTNYDLALLRWGLATLIDVAEKHPNAQPPPLRGRWSDVLEKLPHYPRDGRSGYLIAQGVPLKAVQRHFSHLLMLYPLKLELPADDDARPLLEKTVDHWAGLCEKSRGSCTGYSRTGAAMFSILLGRREAILGNISALLVPTPHNKGMGSVMGPNTFYGERCKKTWKEACPCFETPPHMADVAQGMLLQSGAGDVRRAVVDVFPGVPSAWKDAAFSNLRADGAFVVSARWEAGGTAWVSILSEAGAPLLVRSRIPGEVRWAPSSVRVDAVDGDLHRIALPKGSRVTLHARSQESFVVRPSAFGKPSQHNFFGKPVGTL